MDPEPEAAPAQKDVPQSEPLNERQVINNAGGFVFKVDDFTRLRRFIILGSNGNNYYVRSEELRLENCECVLQLLADGHGLRVVEEVTRISREGRAPRQATGILVLALCARLGDAATRHAALAALSAVCRTASTLFELVQRCKELGPVTRATRPGDAAANPQLVMSWLKQQRSATAAAAGGKSNPGAGSGGRGGGHSGGAMTALGGSAAGKPSWGRSMRRAVALWYLEKDPVAVAYQATKYSQRNGWSHADLLRLAHPDPEDHAAKRRKAAATAEAEAEAGGTKSATAAPSEFADSDWVMVPQEGGESEGERDAGGGGGTSELGALAAAMTAMKVKEAGAGADAAAVAAAVEAQRVADMKAIFDFLTHGTLPGQEPPKRGARRKAAAGGGDAASGDQTTSEVAAEGAPETATRAPTAEAAAPAEAAMREAAAPSTAVIALAAAAPMEVDGAATPMEVDDAAAAPDAAAPLSPVMQYLTDAHRLRKEIRAPTPLVKRQLPAVANQSAKRSRSRKAGPTTEAAPNAAPPPPPYPAAVAAHAAAMAAAVEAAVSLVRRHRFGHEHVGDTALLRVPELWSAFLEVGMPLTALVRNLGRMTQLGVLDRPDCLARVTARLADARALAAARLHPMTLLEALCTYRSGAGARGVARWTPVPAVCEALEAGFYLAFKNVRPTGRRYMAALDVSGSMHANRCAGMTSLNCSQAAAAMLMSVVRSEPWLKTMAFSQELVPFDLKPEDKLEEVLGRAGAIGMGGTDCALPMLYARERRIPVDVFLVLTDNETWFGGVHPVEALRSYRQEMGLPGAKLVVLGFSATQFSIADPADPGMLDVAGLDSAVPQLVADFARGAL